MKTKRVIEKLWEMTQEDDGIHDNRLAFNEPLATMREVVGLLESKGIAISFETAEEIMELLLDTLEQEDNYLELY